jgi:hypothetical protein
MFEQGYIHRRDAKSAEIISIAPGGLRISLLPLSRKEIMFSLCDLCVLSEAGGEKVIDKVTS